MINKNNIRVSAVTSKEIYEAICIMAKQQNKSVSNYISSILETEVVKNGRNVATRPRNCCRTRS